MKRRNPRQSLVARAVERAALAKWRSMVAEDYRSILSTAEIQAMQSDHSANLVNTAGRVLFVVLGAAVAEGVDDADPHMQAVIAAVNAVHDQAGVETIEQAHRDAIVHGLGVSVQLLEVLEHDNVVDAACELELKMQRQHITIDDFRSLFQPNPPRQAP